MDKLKGLMLPAMAFVLLGLAGCPKKPPTVKSGPGPGEITFPVIEPPEIKPPRIAQADLKALPKGARANLPSHDLGRVFMRLPPQQASSVSTADVARQVIEPLLKAAGFKDGVKRLRTTTESGLPQARAELKGVAALLANEYQGNERATRQRTLDMVDAFLGKKSPTADVEQNLQIARGLSFAQFKADIERQETIYPFLQVDGDVPIEHTLLLASRWEGQTITSVRGTLLHNYSIGNARPANNERAGELTFSGLLKVKGIQDVGKRRVLDGPWLVLLPYGNDSSGNVALRYSWRMVVEAQSGGKTVPFRLWSDAATGQILKMYPLLNDVGAIGSVWRRDPGTAAVLPRFFEVDAAAAGQYTLQLDNVASRVDFAGDGFNASDVSISSTTGGSSATLANFNQAPINDGPNAVCSAGGNVSFQQVHYFGLFHLNWSQAISHGIFTPFPTSEWNPKLESATAGCNAWSNMDFGACEGYFNAACPDYSDGTTGITNSLNWAHDSTVVGHELAHNSVDRFTAGRPADWCGTPPCTIPVGFSSFHDLADAWADHFDNTNCFAGWVGKNIGGVNASNNCQGATGHDEGGYLPRLHELTVPFNPATPGDHFPEHRDAATGGYADMQIGAAILWQIREGMRSKCRPSGHPQYFVRFTRALKEAGLNGVTGSGDRRIYNILHDLGVEMIEQWATSGLSGGPPAFAHNGNHTTNKVVAGFARGGVFPIPSACFDGDAATSDAAICPTGENAGEAVIDIDDNDPGDDLTVDDILHPEFDFLELGGAAPTFRVWTGPRYRFSANSARPITGNAICNTKYIVEVATDATFPAASTINSGWVNVDLDTSTAASPECYGDWTPTGPQWTTLQAGGANTRLYYRTRTRDAADGNERISTQPGAATWTVPPPYAVITTTGGSDY